MAANFVIMSQNFSATTTMDAVLEANKRVYDAIAEDYENYDNRRNFENLGWIEEKIRGYSKKLRKKFAGEKLIFVDAGSGSGLLSRIASLHFDKVIAIDISGRILERSRMAYIVEKKAGDCCKIDQLVEEAHCIGAFATLHHLLDPKEFLTNAAKVLKKDGILYTDHDIAKKFAKRNSLALKAYRKITEEGAISKHRNVKKEEYMLSEYHGQEGIDFEELVNSTSTIYSQMELRYHWQGMVPKLIPSRIRNYMEKNIACGFYAPVGSLEAVK